MTIERPPMTIEQLPQPEVRGGGCGCGDHEVAPEEVFSDDDKPQE